jgi:hypothetical protein
LSRIRSKGINTNIQYSLNASNMIEAGLSYLDNDENQIAYNRFVASTFSLGWHTTFDGGLRVSFQPSWTKLDYNTSDPVDAGVVRGTCGLAPM